MSADCTIETFFTDSATKAKFFPGARGPNDDKTTQRASTISGGQLSSISIFTGATNLSHKNTDTAATWTSPESKVCEALRYQLWSVPVRYSRRLRGVGFARVCDPFQFGYSHDSRTWETSMISILSLTDDEYARPSSSECGAKGPVQWSYVAELRY